VEALLPRRQLPRRPLLGGRGRGRPREHGLDAGDARPQQVLQRLLRFVLRALTTGSERRNNNWDLDDSVTFRI
jgi:hypothetical protein